MGGHDMYDIHGDGDSHNLVLVDLNLEIHFYSKGLKETRKLSEGFGYTI